MLLRLLLLSSMLLIPALSSQAGPIVPAPQEYSVDGSPIPIAAATYTTSGLDPSDTLIENSLGRWIEPAFTKTPSGADGSTRPHRDRGQHTPGSLLRWVRGLPAPADLRNDDSPTDLELVVEPLPAGVVSLTFRLEAEEPGLNGGSFWFLVDVEPN